VSAVVSSQPQVGLANPLVLEKLRARAGEDDAARLEDEAAVGDAKG